MGATTKTAGDLFTEYRLDLEAALEPCIMCLMEKCPESERAALDALLDNYWEEGHQSPPYSPVQMRRIHAKMEPLFQRAMNDPAVIASDDQRKAQWRDTPRWKKVWFGARFKWTCVRIRVSLIGRKPPWE